MARPKEFDQEKALQGAIGVFSQKGFAAASTDDLMRAMSIARQSMYDTFGDKRALYLRALEAYVLNSVQTIRVELQAKGSALAAIRNTIIKFSERTDLSGTDGCMGVNAICEFGQRDEEISLIIHRAAKSQRHALMEVLIRARDEGEIAVESDLESLANFFDSTLAGLRVASKAGKPRSALKGIALIASTCFR
jgi:TetR/AcrR family transcriptional repressor of nem operon